MATAWTDDERAAAAYLSHWFTESAMTTEHHYSSMSMADYGTTARGDSPVPWSPPPAFCAPDDDVRPRGVLRSHSPGCSPAWRRGGAFSDSTRDLLESAVGSPNYQSRESCRRPLRRRSAMDLDHDEGTCRGANDESSERPSRKGLNHPAMLNAAITGPCDGGSSNASKAGGAIARGGSRSRSSDSFLGSDSVLGGASDRDLSRAARRRAGRANDESSERPSDEGLNRRAMPGMPNAPRDCGGIAGAGAGGAKSIAGAGGASVARRRCRSSDSVLGSSDYQSCEARRLPLRRRITMDLDHHEGAYHRANDKSSERPSRKGLNHSARLDATTVPRNGEEERADEAGREGSARRRCRSSDSFLGTSDAHFLETPPRPFRRSTVDSSTGWRSAVPGRPLNCRSTTESSPCGGRGHHSRRVHFARQGEDGQDERLQCPRRQCKKATATRKSKTRIINEVHFDEPDGGGGATDRTSNHFNRRVVGTADQKMEPGGRSKNESKNQLAHGRSRTRVMNLPWTDRRGVRAHYSGEVDELIRPHGHGTLLYDDGGALECIWNNGSPLWDDGCDPVKKEMPTCFHRRNSKSPSCIKELSRDSHRRASAAGMPPLPFQPPCYDLGDVGSPEDMIVGRDPAEALENAKSLRVHDFAFVRRSDGSWTYAIIANFPVREGKRASIRFVTNQRGSTKTLERKHWAKFIRLANLRSARKEGGTSPASDDAVPADARTGRRTPRTWRRSTGHAPFRW